jgi:hypothetical protein
VLVQDTNVGGKLAFKVTTKPLVILNEDLPQVEEVGSADFCKNLERNSWEYRCGI